MPRARSGHCSAVWAATLTLLTAVVPVVAQDRPLRPLTPPAGPAGGPAGTTLYLVLRTGPKESETAILETIKKGLDLSGAASSGAPSIKAVSPAFFEEFEAIVDRAGGSAAASDRDGFSIRMLPSRDTTYEIRTDAAQVLKSLTVTYQKSGAKEYMPAPPGTRSPLVLIVPGKYALTPEPGDVPLRYTGVLAELGKDDKSISGTWPAIDKFFVVTVRGFVGDRKQLFSIIQDKKRVANPFSDVKLGSDLLFSFASLNSTAGKTGKTRIEPDGSLNLAVETINDRDPRRVWVYFPLDETAMLAARDRFRKFSSVELPVQIRRESVAAGQPAAVGPKDAPKWYELPADVAGGEAAPKEFVRKVKLNSIPEFAGKYPVLWMLVVWEFDAGKPEAILVEHPKDDRVYVLEREQQGWQEAINEFQKKPSPPKP